MLKVSITIQQVPYLTDYIFATDPPSISIDKINDGNVLRCNPNGNPNIYKFYSWLHLSEFGETIRQFNRTNMITFCPKDPSIRRYQCNGIYICKAENGIKDVSGKLIQSGKVLERQKGQYIYEGHFFLIVKSRTSNLNKYLLIYTFYECHHIFWFLHPILTL